MTLSWWPCHVIVSATFTFTFTIMLTMVSSMPQCHDHVDCGLLEASMSRSFWLCSRTCLNGMIIIVLTMVSNMSQCHVDMLLTFSYTPQNYDHVVYGLVHASKSWLPALSMVMYKPQSHDHVVYDLVQTSMSSCCFCFRKSLIVIIIICCKACA